MRKNTKNITKATINIIHKISKNKKDQILLAAKHIVKSHISDGKVFYLEHDTITA